jgi:hypothetical protein
MLVYLAGDVFIGTLHMTAQKKTKKVHCGGIQVIHQSSWFEEHESNLFRQCKRYA